MREDLVLDAQVPCLCCNKTTLVNLKKWESTPNPVALCRSCAVTVPIPLVRALFMIRVQLGVLQQQLTEAHEHIRRLYSAQQDVEEMLTSKG